MTELGISFPPHRLVRELGEHLEPNVSRSVLDAGCGTGRNAQYLAGLGHKVVGLDMNILELQAMQLAEHPKDADSTNLCVVASNVQKLPFGTTFDIACMNELNLLMSKTATRVALTELRRVTMQGGLNLVSGYLLAPNEGTDIHQARAFKPNELREIYVNNGWDIVHYEELSRPLQYVSGKEIISSSSMMIAQRPWNTGSAI